LHVRMRLTVTSAWYHQLSCRLNSVEHSVCDLWHVTPGCMCHARASYPIRWHRTMFCDNSLLCCCQAYLRLSS
jgi:hypothetical protein